MNMNVVKPPYTPQTKMWCYFSGQGWWDRENSHIESISML